MKEFIEKLIGRLEENKKEAQNEGSLSFAMGFKVAKQIVNELAEEYSANTPQKSEGGWIPVTKRLPETFEDVLIWCKGIFNSGTCAGEECQWYGIGYRYGVCWCNKWKVFQCKDIKDIEVIAWQPLPAPYRMEKSENAEWKEAVMNHFTKIE